MKVEKPTASQSRLKQILKAGSIATQTKTVLNGMKESTRLKNEHMKKPYHGPREEISTVQKLATTLKRLNIFGR